MEYATFRYETVEVENGLNKAGRTRRDFSRPIFVDRLNSYMCGINFLAILVGRSKSGNIKLF